MPRPNILLITTDQQNASILGYAGDPLVRTPNLDRLAAGGVAFDAAFTPHPVCTPARTSIFTGQYAVHHGVPYNINLRESAADPPHMIGLSEDATAFPEVLARAGYDTAFFGKLHAVQAGDRSFGLRHTRLAEGKGQFVEHGSGPDDYRQYLLDRGYPEDIWRTWELPEYPRDGRVASPLSEEDYIDTWTATEGCDYLGAVDEPFFAWISFSNPHTPWDPPEPYASMYDPADIPMPTRRRGELEEKNPDWVAQLARTIPAIPPRSTDPERDASIDLAYSRFPDEQVRKMLAAYYGEVTHLDTQVGRLLAALDERGLTDDTLIIFTADHGDYCGRNWAFFKYSAFYDSLARVPFIVSWPGQIGAGARRDELVCLTDVAPTLLAAADLQPVGPVDGAPLQPLLTREAAPWREEVVLDAGNVRALLTPRWKYMHWQSGFEELYDRAEDPGDLHNLATRGESTRSDLAARLASHEGQCY